MKPAPYSEPFNRRQTGRSAEVTQRKAALEDSQRFYFSHCSSSEQGRQISISAQRDSDLNICVAPAVQRGELAVHTVGGLDLWMSVLSGSLRLLASACEVCVHACNGWKPGTLMLRS